MLVLLGLDQNIEDLAFGVDGAPQIDHASVDFQIGVSGAGEFRPRALSEPDVILSHHPAPIVQPLLYRFCSIDEGPPVAGCPHSRAEQRSIRSSPITGPSSLLRIAPPLCPTSYSHPHGSAYLDFSLNIRATGSRVPHKSLDQSHAAYAGCRLGRNRAIPQTRPRLTNSPWFRNHLALFDTSSAVGLRSSL
jgi:hypothetical protein